ARVADAVQKDPHPPPFAFDHGYAVIHDRTNDGGVTNLFSAIAVHGQIPSPWSRYGLIAVLAQNALDFVRPKPVPAAGEDPSVTIAIVCSRPSANNAISPMLTFENLLFDRAQLIGIALVCGGHQGNRATTVALCKCRRFRPKSRHRDHLLNMGDVLQFD